MSDYAVAARQAALELAEAETGFGLAGVDRIIADVRTETVGSVETVIVKFQGADDPKPRDFTRIAGAAVAASVLSVIVGIVAVCVGLGTSSVGVADIGVGMFVLGVPATFSSVFAYDKAETAKQARSTGETLVFDQWNRLSTAALAVDELRKLKAEGIPGIRAASEAWDQAFIAAVRLTETIDHETETRALAVEIGNDEFDVAAGQVVAALEDTLTRFEARAVEQLKAAEQLRKVMEFNTAAERSVTGALLDDAVVVEMLSQGSLDAVQAITATLTELPGLTGSS